MLSREIDGLKLTFHLAGINNQNFLMRDEETGTYWQQINGVAVSGAVCVFGAAAGLISILACCARVSDVGGAISPDCRDAGGASEGFPDAAGAVAAGAVAAGAADTAACGTSAVGDGSADGFSGCWKATSIM